MPVKIFYQLEGDFLQDFFETQETPDNLSELANLIYSHLMSMASPLEEWSNKLLWKFKIHDDILTNDNFFHFKTNLHSSIVKIFMKNSRKRPRPSPDATQVVLKQNFLFVSGSTPRKVDSNSPYHNNISFGHYIFPKRSSDLFPMDAILVNLDEFPIEYRSEFHARCVSLAYKSRFKDDNCLSQLRTNSGGNFMNILCSNCQTGKTKMLCKSVFLAYFQSLIPAIFVMNVGGDNHIIRIRDEIVKFTSSCVEFLVDSYGLDRDVLECFFKLELKTKKELSLWKKNGQTDLGRPFGYINRQNPSGILGFEMRFKPNEDKINRIALFLDEDPQPRQNLEGSKGVTEKTSYVSLFGESGKPLRLLSKMSVAFTATPIALLYTENVENPFKINLINVPDPENHVGFSHLVVPHENRRINLICTRSKEKGLTILECDPGIRDMLENACLMYPNLPYVSCLITTSKNRGNNEKSKEACHEILSLVPEAIVFSVNCKKGVEFHFKLNQRMPNIFLEYLRNLFRLEFILRNDALYLDSNISLSRCYDIARSICEYKQQKFFVVCFAGNSANLGNTFKTSDHDFPLNFAYISEKTKGAYSHEDMEQMTGRMQSNDNYPHDRQLFMPQESIDHLTEAFEIRQSTISNFSGNTTETTPQILSRLRRDDPQNKMIRAIDLHLHTISACISKKSINSEIVEKHSKPILDYSEKIMCSLPPLSPRYLIALKKDLETALDLTVGQDDISHCLKVYLEMEDLKVEEINNSMCSGKLWGLFCLLFLDRENNKIRQMISSVDALQFINSHVYQCLPYKTKHYSHLFHCNSSNPWRQQKGDPGHVTSLGGHWILNFIV